MNKYWKFLYSALDEGGGGAATVAFDPKIHAPEEFRSEPSLAAIKTVQDIVKGYVSGQKLIGAKRTVVPGDSSTPEQWNAFYNDIGRPEAPEKYVPPEIKDLDPSLKPDPARLATLNKKAHELGLTPKQYRGLLEYHLTTMNEQVKGAASQSQAQADASVGTLRTEWGDKFDTNIEVARSVAKKFGDESLTKYLDQSGMGNNVPFIKLLLKIGGAVMEDHERRGGGDNLDLSDTARAAKEIDTLKLDEGFQKVLGDARNPGHKQALERWINLHTVAHPGKSE